MDKDKEKQKEYAKEYRKTHKVDIIYKRNYMRIYYKKNKQRCNEYNNNYYNKNEEQIKKTRKKYLIKNKEKIRNYSKNYFINHRQRHNELNKLFMRTEEQKTKSKKARLKREYGITIEECENLLLRQDNKCAVCNKKMVKICIDHDHKTGKVRGLLCHYCNTGIGYLKDDIKTLQNAIEYLT